YAERSLDRIPRPPPPRACTPHRPAATTTSTGRTARYSCSRPRMAFTSHELSVPGVEPARRRRPHPRRGRNQLAGVEAGSLGHRHQAALRARVPELRAVRAQDALFDLLAAAFPLRDPASPP